ncbi:MAG: phytase [Bacteroidales bacterium]|nr:phytase [Bacteroidales bacterium]
MKTNIYYAITIICISSFLILGCKNDKDISETPTLINSEVVADLETPPVEATSDMDAADDPAIWIHPDDPTKSLIIATNKKLGIAVYNLQGDELYFYPAGDVNNIDVRYGFEFGNGEKGDIAACSERVENKILFYRINKEDGSLTEIHGDRFMSDIPEVYGFSLYHSPNSGKFYAFMNGKSGIIEQWELSPFEDGELTGTIVATLNVDTQPEGMVTDDEMGHLYVGEEELGIWKFNAEPSEVNEPVFISNSDTSNTFISYDVEGLTIYYAANNKGYLIASSQGNNSYAIFERGGDNEYLGSFSIVDGIIDGVQETDGIDVINLNLGGQFSKGLFIAQDGENFDGGSILPQNFKVVSWKKIANLFDPPLLTDNTYNISK